MFVGSESVPLEEMLDRMEVEASGQLVLVGAFPIPGWIVGDPTARRESIVQGELLQKRCGELSPSILEFGFRSK